MVIFLEVQRRIVRSMSVIREQQLQRVTAGRQFQMRLRLAQAKMPMVFVVRNDLV